MFAKLHLLLNHYGISGKDSNEFKIRESNSYEQKVIEDLIKNPYAVQQGSDELCETALINAKAQLHPLLQQVDLEKLGLRREFVQAFKHELEKAVATRIVHWLPCVKVVYKFDASRGSSTEGWDNTIHLLILVPRILPSINDLGLKLDNEILKRLKKLGWSRFQDSKSVIEIQQVTSSEIRHGVCYGAMFYSFYTTPSKVWPQR